MGEIGQITKNTDRGKSIIKIIKEKKPSTIVEIGTWKGGGTTTCILETIDKKTNFISIESKKEFFDEAKNNLLEYSNNFELLHGRIIEPKDALRFFNSLILDENPEVTPDQHLTWFLEDLKSFESCPNVLDTLPKEIDMLILDGGEYSTKCEWEVLKERVKIVVLDDINMVKTKEIYQELKNNINYSCLNLINHEGNGFAIFENIKKPISTFGKKNLSEVKNSNTIITATNSPYYESLLGLISSIHKFGYNTVDKVLVYDIGLTQEEINSLRNLEKVDVIEFTEDEKNSHPEFLVGKSHVYKNYCLKHASKFNENVLWVDSGACFINNFDEIFEKIDYEDIFLVGDIHLNKTYTHDECVNIMNATEDELMSNQLWSGLVGFKSEGKYQELIDLSSDFSLVENCCNGNHQNHRHDQSILSILAYRYSCPQQDIDKYGYWTDAGRNLETARQYGSIVFAHRRGYIDKSNLIQNGEDYVEQPKVVVEATITPKISVKPTSRIKLVDENLGGQEGLSRYISPETGWTRDMGNNEYDIAIHTDRMCYNVEPNPEKTNYAWLIEPPMINGENYSNITQVNSKFKKVFSHNLSIEGRIDNFVYVPHCGTWLRSQDIGLHDKNKNISFTYSDKQWNPGHRLRHNYANFLKEKNISVDHYGSGSQKPIEFKIESLKDYRFAIVMENSVQDDYFTEKLIDCFLSGTIPIYWGTKNVSKYFDSDGIIFLPNIDEWGFNMDSSLELITQLDENYYQSKLSSIINNFNTSQKYIHPENFILDYIQNEK
jgi:hypothetical protein